eukprot:SAG22_NODE_47_length_24699_cov_13.602317_7_plen_140_part_00
MDQLTPVGIELQERLGANVIVPEARRSIRLLKKGVAPGPNRVTSEVYQEHGHLWAVVFTRVFNACRRRGRLPASTMQGIITLLFKKGDPRLLSQYRGLTMLQRDYVLLATIMALRLRRAAGLICTSSQKAFISLIVDKI